ncbi:MAG: LysE family transporter [Candidatus Dormibacteraeota bacterium]|nr:LysE family transporter [Candidatus Dormibacteraeota bacterium]
MSSILLGGFALGFAVAASPGPIFFLCLKRTLLQGRLHGLVSGLGVATADGFYAAIASLGLAVVSGAAAGGRRPLAVIGGAVLIGLGLRILFERKNEPNGAPAATGKSLAWAYLSTLALTITNPATIVSFAAFAPTVGLGAGGGLTKPAVLVCGVLVGSAAWWCLLAAVASSVRGWLTPAVIRGISTFSGLAIAMLGMLAIYSAFS